jgi:ABC-type nitrate/sulfonate/bicarbonate transport system permease component
MNVRPNILIGAAVGCIAAVCIAFGVWEACIHLFKVPEFVLPPPSRVAEVFRQSGGYLIHHSAVTLLEAAVGLLVAICVGLVSGALIGTSLTLRRALTPPLVALQAVPIVALAPLLVLWFGVDLTSKIAVVALLGYFPIAINFARGLNSVSSEQRELFQVFGASWWQTFTLLRLPASASYVLTGVRVAAASAMLGAIVGEYMGANVGIGYVITQANYRVETPLLFAAVFTAAALSGIFFLAIVATERLLFFRYTRATTEQ